MPGPRDEELRTTESQLLWRRRETVLNSVPITSEGAEKETDTQDDTPWEGPAGGVTSVWRLYSEWLPQERCRELSIKTGNSQSPNARTNWIL